MVGHVARGQPELAIGRGAGAFGWPGARQVTAS
jgi:hypothetical protein